MHIVESENNRLTLSDHFLEIGAKHVILNILTLILAEVLAFYDTLATFDDELQGNTNLLTKRGIDDTLQILLRLHLLIEHSKSYVSDDG